MKKSFNVAGPCVSERHYMLPAAARLPDAPRLIEDGAYFAVHAPRQTGKTTTLRAIAQEMTAAGEYTALHFSCEQAEAFGDDIASAERVILDTIAFEALDALPSELRPPPWPEINAGSQIRFGLGHWARNSPRPLVLFFDEIDAVRGRSLFAVLKQLRAGFPGRPRSAPWSVALCGLRDVRDYKAASGGDPTRLGTASPFNIKSESMRLGSFTGSELARLYRQHTDATGQRFTDAAVEQAYAVTGGQPWLTNALAHEIITKMGVAETIDVPHIEAAQRRLALSRATHLDSLLARLREPRVRRIIEPILAGQEPPGGPYDQDYAYVHDLGLVVADPTLRIANPIYAEVISRTLGASVEADRLPGPQRAVRDGRLDLPALLTLFADWWRENGEIVAGKLDYHEIAPQLVLMAFLQRIVNGGGFIDREFGIGRRRIDLLVRWPLADGTWQREAIEIKFWSDQARRGDPLDDGLRQLDAYLIRLGLDHGALVIFDRRTARAPIDDRVAITEAETPTSRRVWVLRA